MKRKNRKYCMVTSDFTLIELLIVLSIMVILIGLLVPALKRVNEKMDETACSKNLANQGLAVHSYSVDNSGKYPYNPNAPASSGDAVLGSRGARWENNLSYYLGVDNKGEYWNPIGSNIFLCPAAPVELIFVESENRWKYFHDGSDEGSNNTYEGMNAVYNALNKPEVGRAMLKISYPENPMGLPLQFCSRRQSPIWEIAGKYSVTNNLIAAASWHDPDGSGARPTLFVDGHAKVLLDDEYTKHQATAIQYGPYSGWQLETGNGSPAHRPYDFWIDEY